MIRGAGFNAEFRWLQGNNLLFSRSKRKRRAAAANLYASAVDAARQPVFYGESRTEDNLDGRFDLILLHVFLLTRRLEQLGKDGGLLSRALQEWLVADMDRSLREMGVGDLSVGKKVKAMGQAWFGRREAYLEAFAGETAEERLSALTEALGRNILKNENAAFASELAAYAVQCDTALANRTEMSEFEGGADLQALFPVFDKSEV